MYGLEIKFCTRSEHICNLFKPVPLIRTQTGVILIQTNIKSSIVSAKEFVDTFRDELIGRRIAPKKIVSILLNIDETGIVYKSVPKRTYKFIGTPFMATSYTFVGGQFPNILIFYWEFHLAKVLLPALPCPAQPCPFLSLCQGSFTSPALLCHQNSITFRTAVS